MLILHNAVYITYFLFFFFLNCFIWTGLILFLLGFSIDFGHVVLIIFWMLTWFGNYQYIKWPYLETLIFQPMGTPSSWETMHNIVWIVSLIFSGCHSIRSICSKFHVFMTICTTDVPVAWTKNRLFKSSSNFLSWFLLN